MPGKSDLAKAFRYVLSRWPSFCLFLEDGRVAIDNNAAERAMRRIGIGRKKWFFAGADTGTEALARAMTLFESGKVNGIDRQAYLADVLDRIHDHKINRIYELMPWNWGAAKTVVSIGRLLFLYRNTLTIALRTVVSDAPIPPSL